MRVKARGTPRDASLANQADVIINAVDSLQIRLAVTGTSYDKYPGKSHCRPPPSGEGSPFVPSGIRALESNERPIGNLADDPS